MRRLSYIASARVLSRVALAACALMMLSACFDTHGAIDPRDGGRAASDGGLRCIEPDPVCEPDATSPECTCAAGDPVSLDVQPDGYGESVRSFGLTTSGGLVALRMRSCIEDCADATRASLEVMRFDANGDHIGDAIEVARSPEGIDADAVLRGSSLALVWADERRGLSGLTNLWFGELDADAGTWTVAPHLVIALDATVHGLGIARGMSGFGVVYAAGDGGFPLDAESFFARLDDSGALIAAPAPVGSAGSGFTDRSAITSHGDGYALARWDGDAVVFHTLGADGSVSAPVPIAENLGDDPHGDVRMHASAAGYAVAWTDAMGLRLARTDANGALDGAIVDLGPSDLDDMIVEDDGTIALVWTTRDSCWLRTGQLMLTRVEGGERVHPDVVVDREPAGSGLNEASLAWTPSGLLVVYTDIVVNSEESTAQQRLWVVTACAP